jgi:hypothetical protein
MAEQNMLSATVSEDERVDVLGPKTRPRGLPPGFGRAEKEKCPGTRSRYDEQSD